MFPSVLSIVNLMTSYSGFSWIFENYDTFWRARDRVNHSSFILPDNPTRVHTKKSGIEDFNESALASYICCSKLEVY